jgi:hypothetical protein
LEVEPTVRFEPPLLTAIPHYPSLPMEKNIWGVQKTDKPGIFLRRFGKGRVVYFPWDIDRVRSKNSICLNSIKMPDWYLFRRRSCGTGRNTALHCPENRA